MSARQVKLIKRRLVVWLITPAFLLSVICLYATFWFWTIDAWWATPSLMISAAVGMASLFCGCVWAGQLVDIVNREREARKAAEAVK